MKRIIFSMFIAFGAYVNVQGQNQEACLNQVIESYGLKDVPNIGEVISTFLDFETFAKLNGDTGSFDPSTFKWAPADGRNVSGSIYACLQSKDNLPDLRGLFMRGVNEFYSPNQPVISEERLDPEIREPGDYQNEEYLAHSHSYTKIKSAPGISSIGVRNNVDGLKYEEVNTNQSGGVETRPKNVAVNYFIRIN